jgi:asparagine synthase (glutamine-hydrolysing)
MCGIAGILGAAGEDFAASLQSMADALAHRGPDADGIWHDAQAGVGLAHRRLSILDLSPQGAQPMRSPGGRFVLSFNGEIYNHATLRAALDEEAASAWRGHSDTEVLVAAIERWGVAETLRRANGMFAFAVWDRADRRLTLARDRLGEKPLYAGLLDGRLVFASELNALRRLPGWRHAIEPQALGLLLRYGYVPAPWSIHPGIFKLPAAHSLCVGADTLAGLRDVAGFTGALECYWDLRATAAASLAAPFAGTQEDAIETLDTLLARAVRLRMEADVPIGAMLSGGVDSSLVTALMQAAASRRVRTFTVGFGERRYDEAPHARRVATHLGTDHTELEVSAADALALVPRVPELYDEPFADPSQLPTALISAVARRQVTVALSGDGGDELFAGYTRYFDALAMWPRIASLGAGGRAALGAALEGFGAAASHVHADAFRVARIGRRVGARDFADYYGRLLSQGLVPTAATAWPARLPDPPCRGGVRAPFDAPLAFMRLTDQQLYLPEDILTKVDRASMAASLELRVPLLDPDVLAFAWRLPAHLLTDGRRGKLVLKALLHRYVPKDLVERPKQGFEVPLASWLRGPLRDWMRDLLAPRRLGDHLAAPAVTRLMDEHLAGRADHGLALWPVLMFQAWQERYGASAT